MSFFNSLGTYISIATEIVAIGGTLRQGWADPASLSADVVWLEVEPVLQGIGALTKHVPNMVIAEKIVRDGVATFKDFRVKNPTA